MMDDLRVLVGLGLTLLLVLLRLEASRFGAAEYDEPVRGRCRTEPCETPIRRIGVSHHFQNSVMFASVGEDVPDRTAGAVDGASSCEVPIAGCPRPRRTRPGRLE